MITCQVKCMMKITYPFRNFNGSNVDVWEWPVTRSFDVFFDLRLNNRLSKQWRGLWFETPSRPLWRHCNGYLRPQISSRRSYVFISSRKYVFAVPGLSIDNISTLFQVRACASTSTKTGNGGPAHWRISAPEWWNYGLSTLARAFT